jgi:tetratricopeptide (TPR) repeat protein
MEDKARPAAVAVASSYYDTGLASGNVKAFRAGASYYDILLEHQPNGPESNTWRLRRAHCYYFSGELDEAAKLYAQLKSEFKVDDDTLQVASYQLVLANEKRWRDAFAKAADQGNDPLKDTATIQALGALEKSVDEFAARFPSQSRSIDLLLVAASAGRDMDRYDSASRYWQRVLVSQPTPAQRGLAVRGMVFARMKTGSPGDVVEAARRFLKLEDWNTLGANLANEMRGVLSAAALDEGKRLNGSGKVQDAGQMLTQVAEEFPELPDRDRIWRDGAYMLAIAGDWGRAQKAAENYFAAGMLKNRADMTYLLARAHEYQLKLLDAAKKYFELGEKYPSHTRAGTSLTRAEKLALAEGDYALAAQAAAVQAEHAKRKSERLAHYARAVEYLDKADDPEKATSIAKRRLRASDTAGERIKSRLLLARATYKSGSEQEALDEITIISKDIDRQRAKLEPQEYAALAGETHFLLGEEARRKFEDFRIAERGGDAVAAKSRLFEELVASYDRAAAAGDPKWATQSRFLLAGAAESFADEVAGEPARTGQATNSKTKSRYESTVDRLRALAKKYYSTNVLAARKDPARYRDDEWVKKSSLRLTGEASDLPESRHRDVIPTAARDDLPSDWSL